MAETTKPEKADPKRYAAYNLTYLRFIGTVHDTKRAVSEQDVVKAATAAGRDVEVREV